MLKIKIDKSKILPKYTTLLLLLISNPSLTGPPPRVEIPSTFPGEVVASSSMHWIGPYVLVNNVTINDNQSKKVTWFSDDGDILKEITGRRIEANSYYIKERKKDTTLIHSLYYSSAITLLHDKLNRSRGIRGYEYGKYFYRQYLTEYGIYTDFYANGSFVGTYGPHCWITGSTFNVSKSGSFACTISDSTSGDYCRIISVDSLGKEVFSFNSDGPLIGITPSLNGEMVIINYNLDKINNRGSQDFACFFSSGDIVRKNLWPNGRLIGWIPNTKKMIISTSVGEDYTYSLLNWKTGELEWSVNDPLEYTPNTSSHGMAISKDFLILSGLAIRESIAHGPVIPNNLRGTIRMLAAIDIKKGKLVAKWYEPTFSGRWQVGTGMSPMPNRGGNLIWYDNSLYHLTESNFSIIDFNEIENLTNGWVRPTDSGRVCNKVIY
jgi:hypothetical protein